MKSLIGAALFYAVGLLSQTVPIDHDKFEHHQTLGEHVQTYPTDCGSDYDDEDCET